MASRETTLRGRPSSLWWSYVGCLVGIVAAVLPLAHRLGTARGYIIIGVPTLFAVVGTVAIHATRKVGRLGLFPLLSGLAMMALLVLVAQDFASGPFTWRPDSGMYLGFLSAALLLTGGLALNGDRERRW